MAIYRLLQNSSFGPEEVAVMTEAYEQTLLALGVTNRSDPITEEIALKIIAMTRAGESDPTVLSARAAEELSSCSPLQS